MTVTKYKPSTHLLRDVFFPKGFDSMMNSFLQETDENLQTSFFRPSVDVVEHEENYEIHVSIPGVKREDITLDVQRNQLIVSGERKQVTEKKEAKYHTGEIRYGKFSRTFYLPDDVNHNAIEAKFEDGVLNIQIPKAEQAKPKTIKIK